MEMCKELNKVISNTKDQIEDEANDDKPAQLAIMASQPEPVQNALVSKSATSNGENVQPNIVPFEPNWGVEPDFDLMAIVAELEDQQLVQIYPMSNTLQHKLIQQQWNSPMFAGCKIGNITININKK